MKRILKIEAGKTADPFRKIRVAAYARVSSDSEEQFLSLEVQKEHYENYIKSNPYMEYAGLYVDDGISGTKTDKRKGLQQLLKDCEQGKIDRIITKSISRFARNTVDCLEMVRKLMHWGVQLYFEKENIDTAHMKSELMLSILSSIAESESRSISENNTWSIQKRFENGNYIISVPAYGYKNENGKMIIVPTEAAVVQDIFAMALQGKGVYTIANVLNARKIPSKKGGKWHASVINAVLHNEKYTGDAIFQKTYTDNNFNRHRNHGEKSLYKMENHHEAIVSHETFARVKELMALRRKENNIVRGDEKYHKRYAFSGKIRCGECSGKWRRRIIYKQHKAYSIWACTTHLADTQACSLKCVQESLLKITFLQMLNKLKVGHLQVLTPFIESLRGGNNEERLRKVIDSEERRIKLQEQNYVLTQLWGRGYIEMVPYYQESNRLKAEIEACTKEKQRFSNRLNSNLIHVNEAQKLQRFVGKAEPFTVFKDEDFLEFVDGIVIKSRTNFIFILKCGLELEEEMIENGTYPLWISNSCRGSCY